eukprot:2443917-Rhodomonas_salina.1
MDVDVDPEREGTRGVASPAPVTVLGRAGGFHRRLGCWLRVCVLRGERKGCIGGASTSRSSRRVPTPS